MTDDNNNQNDNHNLVATQLPKPITFTGSKISDEPEEKTTISDDNPITNDEEEILNDDSDSSNSLPMPVVFGEDDDETEESNLRPTPNIGRPVIEVPENQNEMVLDDNQEQEEEVPSFAEPESQEENLNGETSQEEATVQQPESALSEPETEQEQEEKMEAQQNNQFVDNNQTNDSQEEPAQTNFEPINQIEENQAVPTPQETHFDIPALTNPANQNFNQEPRAENNLQDQATPQEIDTILNLGRNANYPQQPTGSTLNTQDNLNSFASVGNNNLPDNNVSKNSSTSKFFVGLIAIVIGGSVVTGGYFAANKIFGKSQKKPVPNQAVVETQTTPTIAPAQTASPSAAPEADTDVSDIKIDKADVKIKILNGTGEKGIANKVKTKLEEDGFVDVKTGNADNYNYTKTEVNYKSKYLSLFSGIQKLLEPTYKAVKGEVLKTSDDFDIYIILGGTAAKTQPVASPSPSAKPKASPTASASPAATSSTSTR